eukprot:Sspe_Gene.96031::Locus_68421_Transcript_3_7_Confidence_0.385_Length_927::g.96031::m.96031/K15109/SLC25A20_29, CACT, CACL, CRC1; solute carrier family 25 (mitochondrial carnitine/acylcarnitine transporter), member 20/29
MALDAFVAGGLAGASGLVVTQPLDTVRIRLQVDKRYRSTLDCFRTILREEGVSALGKGIASPMATVGLMNAVLFVAFERALRYQCPRTEDSTIRQHALAGVVAGGACALINSPTELVKCRAQMTRGETSVGSEMQILRELVRMEGVRGVSRGLGMTVVRDAPSFAAYFAVYESLERKMTEARINSSVASLVAGGCAGTAAWLVVYPIDVVKTRWQTNPSFRSVWHAVPQTRADLFRGLFPTLLRAWPQHAVTFYAYTTLKAMWEMCSYPFPRLLISC